MSKGFVLAAVVLVAAAIGAGAAKADSLVYTNKSGKIFISNADGTGAHAVTATTGWSYPSQSSAGLISALQPDGSLAVMSQFGKVRNVVPTPSSVSGGWDVTLFPRISPDGSKIAFTNLDPFNGATVYWSPSTATTLTRPNQTLGQEAMTAPSWVNSTKMMLTHFGQTVTDTEKQLWFYNAGGADDTETGWAIDPFTPSYGAGDPWEATGFSAAINHQQTAVAFAMNDAADYGGTIHHAAIDVFKTTGTPGALYTGQHCRVTLMPHGGDTISDEGEISPSFSPDGTRFAFATNSGVWVTTLPTDWSNCATMTTHRVVAGGLYPFWSSAAVRPLTLLVKKTGTGTGSVTSWPAGISCGTTCSHAYASGSLVTLTAHPASSSVFAGWSGACTGTTTCKVTMTAARSVYAAFKTK